MVSPKVKREDSSPEIKIEKGEFAESSHPDQLQNTPLEEEDDDEIQILENGDEFYNSVPNQLVLYNPEANGTVQQEEPVSAPINYTPPPNLAYAPYAPRVLPSVGAFTVQCANCFKWRLIPTKEKYEEIRESILQVPFVCERAREWRPEISCDDPADISQDGSRLWAIDKPNIAQPPPGWERLLRIRGEGSTRFADVYYVAPSGKRLRSMVEIQKFLLDNPQYCAGGVQMSQFSFQIPKPLQENYVRKRPRADYSMSPAEVSPLSWAGPTNEPQLQLGQPGISDNPVSPPTYTPKKKRTKSPSNSRDMYNNNTPRMKSEEPQFDNTTLNL